MTENAGLRWELAEPSLIPSYSLYLVCHVHLGHLFLIPTRIQESVQDADPTMMKISQVGI